MITEVTLESLITSAKSWMERQGTEPTVARETGNQVNLLATLYKRAVAGRDEQGDAQVVDPICQDLNEAPVR